MPIGIQWTGDQDLARNKGTLHWVPARSDYAVVSQEITHWDTLLGWIWRGLNQQEYIIYIYAFPEGSTEEERAKIGAALFELCQTIGAGE